MSPRLAAAAALVLLATACRAEPPAELDLTSYQDRPCDLLTVGQLAGFHITQPGTPGGDQSRPSCLWQSGDTRILVTIDLSPYVSTAPVSQEAGMIKGFPASHGAIPGKGAQLACATTIDTRRRQTFTAVVYTAANACAASDTIASLVIDTARGAR